jgi:hypothetical protein
MEDGFVGDTTLVIPGGEIELSIGEDGEVDMNVAIGKDMAEAIRHSLQQNQNLEVK